MEDPQKPAAIPTPFCPWCKRKDLPLHTLKIHVKYCDKAPRPRGRDPRAGKPRIAGE